MNKPDFRNPLISQAETPGMESPPDMKLIKKAEWFRYQNSASGLAFVYAGSKILFNM